MSAYPRRRSVLYVPASNRRALDKARSLACDAVILDLEDAVAPELKDEARRNACTAVAEGGFGAREVVIRVNALTSQWGERDLAEASAAAPAALLLPKVETPAALAAATQRLAPHGTTALWAMIETPAAILALPQIAAAAHATPLQVLVMGDNDLTRELGVLPGQGLLPLTVAKGLALLAAGAYGLGVIDGVYNDIADPEGFAAACEAAAAAGFAGKSLIHPSQIEPCNAAFTPSPEQIAWAEGVVRGFELPENRLLAAIRVDGQMVERLHLELARRLLQRRPG